MIIMEVYYKMSYYKIYLVLLCIHFNVMVIRVYTLVLGTCLDVALALCHHTCPVVSCVSESEAKQAEVMDGAQIIPRGDRSVSNGKHRTPLSCALGLTLNTCLFNCLRDVYLPPVRRT